MPSNYESVESETTYPDVLRAMQKVLDGLSELAGLDGFDTLVEKLDEASEECEQLLKMVLGKGPLSPEDYDNVHVSER